MSGRLRRSNVRSRVAPNHGQAAAPDPNLRRDFVYRDSLFEAVTALEDCDPDELVEAARAIGELSPGRSGKSQPIQSDSEELRQSLIETVEHMDLQTLVRTADRLKNMGFRELDQNTP